MAQLSTFIIIEDGRGFAPVTIRSEGLLLGHARQCGLQLDDPSIPAAVGGIRAKEGRFYFLPIEASRFGDTKRTPITINGREIIGDTALAAGDLVLIGGCRLLLEKDGDALVIRLSYPDEPTAAQQLSPASKRPSISTATGEAAVPPPAHGAGSREGDNLLVHWTDRRLWKDRLKLSGGAYLEPSSPKRQPGTAFNWSPTRDLAAPWPASFLFLCLVALCAAALLAFITLPSTFAPGRTSSAHTRTQLSLSPTIASVANSDSCIGCHTLKGTVDQNCARCHQAPGFHASITKEHEAAGVTCISCHTEHQGTDFSPKVAAFASCAACHDDTNKQTYNGKTVHTPHGGTFGYPMFGGKWIWPGLDEEALKLKPEVAATWKPEYDEQTWRKVQFHAIHLYRVKAANGITGIEDGALSCSSCHKAFGGKFDRETPRRTCANCHDGNVEKSTRQLLVEADKPNCTSCHVQHYYDNYRWGDLLTEPAKDKRKRAIDKSYIDAVKRTALPR